MFIGFNEQRMQYANGQIFPFLIALLCVVLIFLMVTVNIGQIGVYRTEAANAADAAALAAASSLSGVLLNLGLISDNMCGYGIIGSMLLAYGVVTHNDFPDSVIYFACIYLALMSHQIVGQFFNAVSSGGMGWSNAKKAAIQYAFNNMGIEEARPTFAEFVQRGHAVADPSTLSSALFNAYYQEYTDLNTTVALRYAQSGFQKFMRDRKSGFWDDAKFGEIRPNKVSKQTVASGYGWHWRKPVGGEYRLFNSYDCGSGGLADAGSCDAAAGADFKNYDNWVSAEVSGLSSYKISIYKLGDVPILGPALTIVMAIVTVVVCVRIFQYMLSNIVIPWVAILVAIIVCVIVVILFLYLFWSIPAGLTLKKSKQPWDTQRQIDRTQNQQIDEQPVTVKVQRHKKGSNMGLWNFSYTDTSNQDISSKAEGRVFCQRRHPNDAAVPLCMVDPSLRSESVNSSTLLDLWRLVLAVGLTSLFKSTGSAVGKLAGGDIGEAAGDAVASGVGISFANDNIKFDNWFQTDQHLFEAKLAEVR